MVLFAGLSAGTAFDSGRVWYGAAAGYVLRAAGNLLNGGGAADIIADGRTGLIVPPADTEAIAQAVLKLYADPDRGRIMYAAARASLDRIATWDNYGTRIAALYRDLADGS